MPVGGKLVLKGGLQVRIWPSLQGRGECRRPVYKRLCLEPWRRAVKARTHLAFSRLGEEAARRAQRLGNKLLFGCEAHLQGAGAGRRLEPRTQAVSRPGRR